MGRREPARRCRSQIAGTVIAGAAGPGSVRWTPTRVRPVPTPTPTIRVRAIASDPYRPGPAPPSTHNHRPAIGATHNSLLGAAETTICDLVFACGASSQFAATTQPSWELRTEESYMRRTLRGSGASSVLASDRVPGHQLRKSGYGSGAGIPDTVSFLTSLVHLLEATAAMIGRLTWRCVMAYREVANGGDFDCPACGWQAGSQQLRIPGQQLRIPGRQLRNPGADWPARQ